ncbi:hypothetical protein GCM10009533_70590 [Saccharopolyspora spinosporotrichia]|uniref:Uncharacterized protein n=1 Tax=Saccharopolyspora erythraea TaxID=1836 RepID=A0ABN1EDL9_SACER
MDIYITTPDATVVDVAGEVDDVGPRERGDASQPAGRSPIEVWSPVDSVWRAPVVYLVVGSCSG